MDELIRVCTICGEPHVDKSCWFLLLEDRWQDRLRILHWDDRLAEREGVHCACSPSHLQELVVHWMTTGSLDHPFARLTSRPLSLAARRRRNWDSTAGFAADFGKPIGELSVHRESMQRVLGENPQSLQTILDALLSALHREPIRPRPELEFEGEPVRIAAREV